MCVCLIITIMRVEAGSCLRVVEERPALLRNAEIIPYLTGGILFLVGTTLLVHASWISNRFSERPKYHERKRKFAGVWDVYPAVGESPYEPPTLPLHDSHMNRARAEREYEHLYDAGDPWIRRRRALDLVRYPLSSFPLFNFFFHERL